MTQNSDTFQNDSEWNEIYLDEKLFKEYDSKSDYSDECENLLTCSNYYIKGRINKYTNINDELMNSYNLLTYLKNKYPDKFNYEKNKYYFGITTNIKKRYRYHNITKGLNTMFIFCHTVNTPKAKTLETKLIKYLGNKKNLNKTKGGEGINNKPKNKPIYIYIMF